MLFQIMRTECQNVQYFASKQRFYDSENIVKPVLMTLTSSKVMRQVLLVSLALDKS